MKTVKYIGAGGNKTTLIGDLVYKIIDLGQVERLEITGHKVYEVFYGYDFHLKANVLEPVIDLTSYSNKAILFNSTVLFNPSSKNTEVFVTDNELFIKHYSKKYKVVLPNEQDITKLFHYFIKGIANTFVYEYREFNFDLIEVIE